MVEAAGLAVLLAIAFAVIVVVLSAAVARRVTHPPRHTAGYAVARGLSVDPGEAGMSFESWTLERPGDVHLPVWEIVGRGAPATVVVFVHDHGTSRIDLLGAIEPWPQLASRLILYDRRRHGEATGPPGPEDHDLVALIEHLGEAPIIVGTGQGGAIAAAVVANRKEVRGLVLAGPFAPLRRRLRTALVNGGCPTALAMPAVAAARLAGARWRDLEPADLAGITVPVLLLATPDDDVSGVRALKAASPNVTLADPERAADALREFIGRL